LRSSLLGIVFAMSCAASPPYQAPNDSEKLYRKMEAALAGAKKLQVDFESATEGSSIKGSFKIEDGNIFGMEVEGAVGAKKYTLSLSCNGLKMSLTRTENPPPPVPLGPQPALPAPKTLTTNVAAALARGGAWLAQEFAEGEYRAVADPYFEERQKAKEQENRPMNKLPAVPPRDVTALHTMENFRPGKSEGGASAVTYDLVRKGGKPILINTMTVWIDSKTGLPVKRESLIFAATDEGKVAGAPVSKQTETYKIKSE